MGIVALLSDFGSADPYAAALKGAILSYNARAVLVDITHEIKPYDITQASFVLWQAAKPFPKGTVFLSAVDPGAGTSRRILAVRTVRHFFVAPDNGVLQFVLSHAEVKEVREVLPKHSHEDGADPGRQDAFARAAARLARANQFKNMGPRTKRTVQHLTPSIRLSPHKIIADIIYRDHFGNCVTNVDNARLESWRKGDAVRSCIKNTKVSGIYENFTAIPNGKAGLVLGSTGLVEIAGNRSSASELLGLGVGDRVQIHRDSRR